MTAPTVPKWLLFARCEYNKSTASVRRIRRYLPLLIILILALHVVYLAPQIVSLLFDDPVSILLSQTALATVQVMFFCLFFYFMVIPFADILRQPESQELDLLLSAPIEPSDLLLGKFLGGMPFYAIFIAGIGAVFTAVLAPLGLGLTQILTIVGMFVLLSLSAFWIGLVASSVLRTRLERLAGGRDIGRALAMALPLPMMVVLYAALGGGLIEFLSRPQGEVARALLSIIPSSWGARVVTDFAMNPGNLGATAGSSLARVGGIALFFIASLWVGLKIAGRAYSLEQISLSSSVAGPDGLLYAGIRTVGGGGSFGTLLASLFKEYGRTLENLSNIGYMMGILIVASIFLPSSGSPESSAPPAFVIMGALFIYPIVSVMVTADMAARGRESIFIYKKAPGGTSSYLKVLIARGYMLLTPMILGATLAMCIISPRIGIYDSLLITAMLVLASMADVIIVIGLFLVNPAFSEKSPRFWLNIALVAILHIALFAVSFFLLVEDGQAPDPVEGLPIVLGTLALLIWLVAAGFLVLARWKLNSIE